MSVVHDELERFHQFATQKLRNGGAESLDELIDLWRLEHPTPEEQDDIHAAIRQGLEDIKAGKGRPADVVLNELRQKHSLAAE